MNFDPNLVMSTELFIKDILKKKDNNIKCMLIKQRSVRIWRGHSRDWQSSAEVRQRQRRRQTTKLGTKDLRRAEATL
jgi:hypothetical protein